MSLLPNDKQRHSPYALWLYSFVVPMLRGSIALPATKKTSGILGENTVYVFALRKCYTWHAVIHNLRTVL